MRMFVRSIPLQACLGRLAAALCLPVRSGSWGRWRLARTLRVGAAARRQKGDALVGSLLRACGCWFARRRSRNKGQKQADVSFTELALLLRTAAAMLRGGVSPNTVWGLLAGDFYLAALLARAGDAGISSPVCLLTLATSPAATQAALASRAPTSGYGKQRQLGWVARTIPNRGAPCVVATQTTSSNHFTPTTLVTPTTPLLPPAPALRLLAATLALAETCGAPLAGVLETFARGVDAVLRARSRQRELLAAPVATVRLLLWLPLVCPVIAALFGVRVWVVYGQPLVWCASVLGVLLLVMARVVFRRLVVACERREAVAGFALQLVLIGVGAGLGAARAAALVVRYCAAFGVEWVSPRDFVRDGCVPRAVAAAAASGVAVGELLRAGLVAEQRRVATEMVVAAANLGVRVLVPVGCFVLPAFVLLGVVPVSVALFAQ